MTIELHFDSDVIIARSFSHSIKTTGIYHIAVLADSNNGLLMRFIFFSLISYQMTSKQFWVHFCLLHQNRRDQNLWMYSASQ